MGGKKTWRPRAGDRIWCEWTPQGGPRGVWWPGRLGTVRDVAGPYDDRVALVVWDAWRVNGAPDPRRVDWAPETVLAQTCARATREHLEIAEAVLSGCARIRMTRLEETA